MKRTIIRIDQDACTGCGLCVKACHEGAIALVGGKARLVREDYCDGLGDCLPACPANAISFEEREAPAYDPAAVEQARKKSAPIPRCCPGGSAAPDSGAPTDSRLTQWPVQIKLAPVKAPWLQGADLLIAADCTAYTCGDFHRRFLEGRVLLIGCTKLDQVDYSEKLADIFSQNHIRSVTVVRMEVPCCSGMELAVRRAIQASGKDIPMQTAVLSTRGALLN